MSRYCDNRVVAASPSQPQPIEVGAPNSLAPSARARSAEVGTAPAHPLELKKGRGKGARPTVHVVAAADDEPSASEWGSLLSDLSRGASAGPSEVEWRVHDKTHLEFAIDYPFELKEKRAYTWEAFFFVPESFRLQQTTYDKKQIYDDLLSYVRLAIPEVAFDTIAEACSAHRCDSEAVGKLRSSILAARGAQDADPASKNAVRRLRVFACVVRSSGLSAQRRMLAMLEEPASASEASRAVLAFLNLAQQTSSGYRALVVDAEAWELPSEVRVALRWVDEDLSLFLETLHATASVRMQQRTSDPSQPNELAARLAADAVTEARYRRDRSYPSVGSDAATGREIEHIEFRRHVLKRFTSSVLWLKHEVRDRSSWVMHTLYAFAAAVAMAFAVFATLHAAEMERYFALSVGLLIVSYAVKDRMKAILQQAFTRWADQRFPDRNWTIIDEERATEVGVVEERAGFRAFMKLPPAVLTVRRMTREHALEEHARPETVLWHQKKVIVEPRKEGQLPSPMMTEIFRLNLGPWLAHTDDPNRTITFADPEHGVVCSANARRVYNLNVIYALTTPGVEAQWKRIRVVVSRKGIERIDPIPV